ncbi:flagellar brake protein [Acidithiobacillus marinus]|nr:flagellar brake protein [Acidithiobacillus marinus]
MVNEKNLVDKLFAHANRLTLNTAVERMLQSLVDAQQNMQVLVGQRNTVLGHTSLLAEDDQKNSLIMDALMPEAVNTHLHPGEDLLLWTVDALPAGFQTTVLEQLTWQRFAAIRIQRPEVVYQWQRRANLRAVLDVSDKMTVVLRRFGARALEGECVNIGAGGMRMRITIPHDYPLAAGELLAQIQFRFQNHPYSLAAKVCYLSGGRRLQGGMQELGLRFMDVSSALEDKIMQFALRYDRECLRRASR